MMHKKNRLKLKSLKVSSFVTFSEQEIKATADKLIGGLVSADCSELTVVGFSEGPPSTKSTNDVTYCTIGNCYEDS